MLIELVLTNFKKHESLTVNFTAGLNVFRASNEAGKSSVYESIGYALWGTRALPESLEETVTWGCSPSSLKVSLTFSVAGTTYKIVRSKSGAELTSGSLVVSGQSEVTAHVERLTGASLKVGSMTLLASQGGLQSSLESSAVQLIEQLSNMALIDKLVTAVQTNLPCGNTKLLEQQLGSLSDLTAPVADFSAQVAAESAASNSILEARAQLDTASSKLAGLREGAIAAQGRLDAEATREQLVRSAELRLQQGQRKVQRPVDDYKGPAVEELEAALVLQQGEAATRNAWERAAKLPSPVSSLSEIEVAAQVAENQELLKTLQQRDKQLAVKHATVSAAIINEESCKLCGKLLTDVPEVVTVNEAANAELVKISDEIKLCKTQVLACNEAVRAGSEVLRKTQEFARAFATLGPYAKILDDSVTPPTWVWAGPSVESKPDTRNLEKLIRDRKAELARIQREDAEADAAESQVSAVRKELDGLRVSGILGDENEHKAAYSGAAQLEASLRLRLKDRERELQQAKSELHHAVQMHNSAMVTYEASLKQAEALKEALNTYVFNNGLIKKLREARPIVARELWNLVVQGVSHTFSQIRGVPSRVTRADDRFLIDGKSASVFSGSTKDALGLAIRIVSQKTFLPNVGFILLDEAASGADSVRETAMLAALASSGFPQVILVTHSELADTFASNLITL